MSLPVGKYTLSMNMNICMHDSKSSMNMSMSMSTSMIMSIDTSMISNIHKCSIDQSMNIEHKHHYWHHRNEQRAWYDHSHEYVDSINTGIEQWSYV